MTGNVVQTQSTNKPPYQLIGCRDITISGNRAKGGSQGFVIGSGTPSHAFDSQDITASSNIIRDPVNHGFSIESPSSGVVISDNRINSPGLDGVSIAVTYTVTVTDNTISSPGRHRISNDRGNQQMSSGMVANNTVIAPEDIGILIVSPNVGGAVISDNYVENAGGGSALHISVEERNGTASNSFSLTGNLASRGGNGINVAGTATNFTEASNHVA